MELSFQTRPINFLRCVVQEVHFQEETSDTIVPDSYPDIAAIIDCYADVILRGKDCRNGSVIIAGGIKGGILYQPDDGSEPKCLELYIPFSMKYEHPELTEHSQILCGLTVRTVDCRVINSRKAMLRVGIGCDFQAYEQTTEALYVIDTIPSELEVKQECYQMNLPLETSEKSFTLNETIDLNGRPIPAKICKVRCQLLPAEQKLIGNKAVFKGNLFLKMQYLSENKELYSLQQQIPYSQYCEFSEEYDQETVTVIPVITGYDLEHAENASAGQISIQAHILAQGIVSGIVELPMITDAYSTRGILNPQWKEYTFRACLDQQTALQTVRKHIAGSFRQILDTDVYWDYPSVTRKQDLVQITVPCSVRVLYEDEQGNISTKTDRAEVLQELVLSNDCICRVEMIPTPDMYAALTTDGIEVRCSVNVYSSCHAGKPFRSLCGGQIEEDPEEHGNKPAVIVRTVAQNTDLWLLAKQYRTSEARICAANHLDGTCVPQDMLLLLPIEV